MFSNADLADQTMSEYHQIWHTNTSRYSLQLLCFGQSLNPTLRCSFLKLKFLARKPLPGTQPCTQLVHQTTRNELSDPRYTTRYTTVYPARVPNTRPCTQIVYQNPRKELSDPWYTIRYTTVYPARVPLAKISNTPWWDTRLSTRPCT